MSQATNKPFLGKLQIRAVEWLSQGWVLGLRAEGGMHVTQIKPAEPLKRANYILDTVDLVAKMPGCTAIFLAKEDLALATEFFPDLFERQIEPPMNGSCLTI